MKSVKLSHNSQSHDCQFEVNEFVDSNNAASEPNAWERVFSQFQVETSLDDKELCIYNYFRDIVRNCQEKDGQRGATSIVEAINSGIEMIRNKVENIN